MIYPDWLSVNTIESLKVDTIHLWRIDLTIDPNTHWQFLNLDEQQRAQKYRKLAQQRRFINTRATLKKLLSRYLHASTSAIKFSYAAHGRPILTLAPHLQFSVSHSADLAVCAITMNHRLGIDLERIKPLPNAFALAKRFFNQKDYQQLRIATDPQTDFFRLWVHKEAYLKVNGEQLLPTLMRTAFVLSANITLANSTDHQWQCYEWLPKSGYTGALIALPKQQLQFFDYNDTIMQH